jgi:predicted nucleic acid-binding protein
MIVISDTSPLGYLLLIDLVDLLPQLYGRVIIPQAVRDELSAPGAPDIVQIWISQPPEWLEIQTITNQPDMMLSQLDLGELEAIALAEQLGADAILLDDREARQIATERGLEIIGLLGILGAAASRGLVDFSIAIERLQQTTFRASSRLIQSLLERYQQNE